MYKQPMLPAGLKALSLAVVATALFTATGSAAHAQYNQSDSNRVVLSSGTVIPVTLDTKLSSDGSSQGDTFTATVDNGKDAYNAVMQGATVKGVVRDSTAQSGDKPGTLSLAFTSLRLADGRSYPISGSLTSLDAKKLSVDRNGMLKAKSTSKNNTLTYAGIGAGAGALVGLLGGGKLKIEDILLGGLAGYGVGTILKSPTQVHDVDLQPGTPMGVMLNNSVRYDQSSQDTDRTRTYHRTYTSGGMKHYWSGGQQWVMDMSTGQRYKASNATASGGKNYQYQGHTYHLDTATGERTQLN